MKFPALLAAVAVSLFLSCRTKQTVTDVHVGALSEKFQKGSSRLLMNDVITWFDISVSDSDTTYTPKAQVKRRLSLEQEDSVSESTFDSVQATKVSSKSFSPSPRGDISYIWLFIVLFFIFGLLLLFLFSFWKR